MSAGGRGRAKKKGSGLENTESSGPPKLHPASLPAQSLTRLWNKQVTGLQGGGEINQNSRKGAHFLFYNTADGTQPTCLPRSICMRRQQFPKSLGACTPAVKCSNAVTAPETLVSASCSCSVRLPGIKGGSLPARCWQEEDIYSFKFVT